MISLSPSSRLSELSAEAGDLRPVSRETGAGRKRRRGILVWLCLLLAACSSLSYPQEFVRLDEQDWETTMRDVSMPYETAWNQLLDRMTSRFEMGMIHRESGYMRTAWDYTFWHAGEYNPEYRVRVTVKFSPPPERSTIRFKTEAQFLHGDKWITGTDRRLSEIVRRDIRAVSRAPADGSPGPSTAAPLRN